MSSASPSGRSVSNSTTATVGRSGPHTNAVYQAPPRFGVSPRRTYAPTEPSSATASKYQLSFQSCSGPGGWRPSSAGVGPQRGRAPGARARAAASTESRSIACWAWRASAVMNMSSPRSVRSTSIDAATAITTPWKAWWR